MPLHPLQAASRRDCSVLFLGKAGDASVKKALSFCEQHFTSVTARLGAWGDPWPADLANWEGDYLISYLSRWVVPEALLKRARITALNFHPAPPEYPGVGCLNFALYEGAAEYGVTCHHMAARVDTGAVVATRRFPVLETDDVESLLQRTHDCQLSLFHEIGRLLAEGRELPVASEQWTRRPFTRRELDALARLTPEMSREEMARRIRATAFREWRPTMEVHGFVFEWRSPTA